MTTYDKRVARLNPFWDDDDRAYTARFDEEWFDGEPFGDDDPPRPDLGLDPAQRAALAAAVDLGLRENGCDSSLRAAQAWALAAGVGWPDLRERLEGRGGYCDCEVLMNALEPD